MKNGSPLLDIRNATDLCQDWQRLLWRLSLLGSTFATRGGSINQPKPRCCRVLHSTFAHKMKCQCTFSEFEKTCADKDFPVNAPSYSTVCRHIFLQLVKWLEGGPEWQTHKSCVFRQVDKCLQSLIQKNTLVLTWQKFSESFADKLTFSRKILLYKVKTREVKVGLGILQITSAKRCPQVWPCFGRSLFSTDFVEYDPAV